MMTLVVNKDKTRKKYDKIKIKNGFEMAFKDSDTYVTANDVRRCLPIGSLVHTKRGMKKIENIEVGDKVLTSHGYDNVGNVFKQGKQNVITILTQDGEFKCTPNHKMAILTSPDEYEWKEAQYLKKGDLLMTSRRSIDGSITKLPESEDVIVPQLDEYVAWFIGMIRSVTPYENIKKLHYISYKFPKTQYKSAIRLKDVFYKFVDSSFEDDEESGYSHSIDFDEYSDFYSVSCRSIEIYNYINDYIMNHKKSVPSYITDATYDTKISYIAGIIDGNANFNTLRKGRVPMNIFTDESLDFMKNLQNLCYSCGFETRLCKNSYGNFHQLNAITNNSINTLLEIKLMNKYDIVESYLDMPMQRINAFPSTMLYSKRKYRIIKNKLGLANYKNISMDIYDEYFDRIGYCPVKVLGIDKNYEFVETYDIEVSKYHEFYCNGYLTHNSAFIALEDCDDIKKLSEEFCEGYNPCFAADTLIAVADGRGAVPIKQLAEEKKDVPVYSVNEEGMVEIKWGRNPRMTGVHQMMVKVILDDGTYVKTTLNHKFRLKDGSCVEAKNLEPKMSLTRLTKSHIEDTMTYVMVNTNTNNAKKGQLFEHKLIAQFHNPDKFNDIIKGDVVVHHKDYNGLNNSPDNLQIMSLSDHDQLGEKIHSDQTKERCADPVNVKTISDSKKEAYEKNPKLKNNLKKVQGENYKKWCEEMMKTSDLDTYVENGILCAKKTCENCKNIFSVPFTRREFAYCSLKCSNTSAKAIENRRLARNVGIKEKQKEVLHNQIMIYKDLQETLGKDPMKKEWENECKQRGVSYRIRHDESGNEFLLRSYQDLKDKAVDYNHRVKSVELLKDTETVYNITVDDNHTVGLFTTYRNGTGDGIFVLNCGQQPSLQFRDLLLR